MALYDLAFPDSTRPARNQVLCAGGGRHHRLIPALGGHCDRQHLGGRRPLLIAARPVTGEWPR